MAKIDPPVSFSDQTQHVYDPTNGCWRTCVVVNGVIVSELNPIPIILSTPSILKQRDVQFRILQCLEKIEKHMSKITDETIDEEDLDDRKK